MRRSVFFPPLFWWFYFSLFVFSLFLLFLPQDRGRRLRGGQGEAGVGAVEIDRAREGGCRSQEEGEPSLGLTSLQRGLER